MVSAQNGIIKGRVFNELSNEPVMFANVVLDSNKTGTITDEEGKFRFDNLAPGTYNVSVTFLGFKDVRLYEIRVGTAKPTVLDIPMQASSEELAAVVVKASPFNKTEESPVSMRTINSEEIFRNPGGNRDISKVIQVLPGVATTISFRNDIIVRGGAPNENRFYLDGIEIPNINHFATQGSSGGPVGMLNVNFIREVDFYAGAFPANRGNSLSSVMEFKQTRGNDEKLTGTFMLGSSDAGLTLDGPMGKNSTFILSARRSYLQFLFQALSLPFLPTYNDFQYKQFININQNNQLTLIGLGAIDDFVLNESANDGLTEQEDIDRNNYILGNIPVNSQWNYAAGANWKHFSENSFQTFVVSRNHLNNKAIKYENNIEDPANLILDYQSEEIENKVRIENTTRTGSWKLNYGAGYEYAIYKNSTFNRVEQNQDIVVIDFDSELTFSKYSVFGQMSRKLFTDRVAISFGIRTDFNDYSSEMSDPIEQLSPRLSMSYYLTEKLSLNGNVGRYYQLPAYTVMGFRDNNGVLVNQENDITYIEVDHYVGGIEYNINSYAKTTVEGFYKNYNNYPFLLADSISLANLGGDFGVIGSEAVSSTSSGRSYGVEFLLQQKLSKSVYGIISYTWVRSEFENKDGENVPSAWDNQHLLNLTAGKRFGKDWEFGAKFRFLGGAPYTPYDIALSSRKDVWDVTGQGIPDWDRLNEERFSVAHGLDVRIDKKWYYEKWALNVYLDIQNLYNFQAQAQPFLDVVRDDNGDPMEDPNDPSKYQTRLIENTSGTVLPSVGIMLEF